LPEQPLLYRHAAPLKTACCYLSTLTDRQHRGAHCCAQHNTHTAARKHTAGTHWFDTPAHSPPPTHHHSPLNHTTTKQTNATQLHPYWFKEFGLDRWCRQDVCMALWLKDHSHDLMYKVTDVCDPKDCPTPLDVKVEPYSNMPDHWARTIEKIKCQRKEFWFARKSTHTREEC
jgi:hypothetical protein